MEKDFSLNGREFKLSKIDAFKQFHIVRRVSPILSELIPALKEIQKFQGKEENLSEEEKFEVFAKLGTPIMSGLSKLTDADSELVLFGLLSAVEVKQAPGNWAKIATGSMLMMQDLELPVLLHCAGRAFMYNLAGFFAGLQAK